MTNRSKNDLEFVVKVQRNLEIEHNAHVILLQIMRHEIIADGLVGSQAMLLGLVNMNHRGPLFVEIDLDPKHYFVYSSKQRALFLYVKQIKARLSITTVILKIISVLLPMKCENKKNHHPHNVSNCFMIMVALIIIGTQLTI